MLQDIIWVHLLIGQLLNKAICVSCFTGFILGVHLLLYLDLWQIRSLTSEQSRYDVLAIFWVNFGFIRILPVD